MIAQKYLLLVLPCLLAGAFNADAFTVSTPPRLVSMTSTRSSISQLWAEESGETEEGEASGSSDEGAATDILSSPAFLKRKIDVLKSDITQADEEIAALTQEVDEGKAEWGDQFDKLREEYSNIQERLGNQNKQGDTMATVQIVREMLEVLDNYDRAFGAVSAESDAEKAIEAEFKATYDQILDIFTELGVTTVESVGKEFDYEVHQAVMQRPSEDFEEGICCEEYAKGFVIGDTLIRAAMVAVAA